MTPSRIDVHQHFLPDYYQAALLEAGLSPPDGMPATPHWSETDAIEALDRLGIRTAFLSISSPGVHFGDDAAARLLARRTNEDASRLARTYPGRFGFFASTPLPDVPGALEEITWAFDTLGADGIVFETNFHGVYLGDDRLAPVYAELNRRRAIVFIHPTAPHCACGAHAHEGEAPFDISLGYPLPMIEFMFETTRTIAHMVLSGTLARYPDIRVIVPHAGAALPVLAARIDAMAKFGLSAGPGGAPAPDVRASLRDLHYDLAGMPAPELLSVLLQIANPAHLHYGSDWPFTPLAGCAMLLKQLETTPLLQGAVQNDVMGGNASRLFPRLRQ